MRDVFCVIPKNLEEETFQLFRHLDDDPEAWLSSQFRTFCTMRLALLTSSICIVLGEIGLDEVRRVTYSVGS